MENILLHKNAIPTFFYIAVALISIVMYNKSNSNYNAKTEKIHSVKSFIYLYKYIQISTFAVCMLSIWMNHKYLFEIYQVTDFIMYLGVSLSGISITLFSPTTK